MQVQRVSSEVSCQKFLLSVSIHMLWFGINYLLLKTDFPVKMLPCASLRTKVSHRVKDQRLLLTANTCDVIVVTADLNQAGNKLLLSDVSSVYSSLTPCLNWRQISSAETHFLPVSVTMLSIHFIPVYHM